MLGVHLDEKDLNAFFGANEGKSSGPMKDFYYPLAFTINPELFNVLKKSFKDSRMSDIHKIYKAYKSGMTIKQMQENGFIDPNIVIKDHNDFISIIRENMPGEIKKTPWGEMEVVSLYNEEFDQDYLNFIRDLHASEVGKKEAKKIEDIKQYENIDPSTINNIFSDVEEKYSDKNPISIKVEIE